MWNSPESSLVLAAGCLITPHSIFLLGTLSRVSDRRDWSKIAYKNDEVRKNSISNAEE
jgi:hypothetical protein